MVYQEGGYDLVRISGGRAMIIQDGDTLSAAALAQDFALLPPCGDLYSYVSRKGCLCLDGTSPISLSEIPAVGRTFPELTQPLVLERVRRALAGEGQSGDLDGDGDGHVLDEWVMANLKDADTRVRCVVPVLDPIDGLLACPYCARYHRVITMVGNHCGLTHRCACHCTCAA